MIAPEAEAMLTLPIQWQWEPVDGAAKYQLFAERNWPSGAWGLIINVVVAPTTWTQTNIPDYPPNATGQGRWRVRGISSDGDAGPWSDWRSFTFAR